MGAFMKKYDIALLGGDKRIAYLAAILAEKGYRVTGYGLTEAEELTETEEKKAKADTLRQAIEEAEILVGGIPMFREGKLWVKPSVQAEGEGEILKYLQKGQKLFGGALAEPFCARCRELGVECFDFMKEESIAIYNAVATAEGILAEAICSKGTNLHKSCCLVLGFGRCGRVLGEKLKGLSACVTVASAQKEELSWADAMGFRVLPLDVLEQHIGKYEYVFNTIPAQILGEKELKRVQRGVRILDIASGGGADMKAAERLGVWVRHFPGIPGRYAAESSAIPLAEWILEKGFSKVSE